MTTPPPVPEVVPKRRKRTKLIIVLVAGGIILAGVFAFFAIKAIIDSGITKGPDQMFGDQHLKTAVALIELHKTRYGEYPEKLRDLKFTGSWDQMALNSVKYIPAQDRESYYVEVTRGWMGRPDLDMPDEFWQGTGYDPKLKPE